MIASRRPPVSETGTSVEALPTLPMPPQLLLPAPLESLLNRGRVVIAAFARRRYELDWITRVHQTHLGGWP